MNTIAENHYLSRLTSDNRQQEQDQTTEESGNELGQTAFLELMITQMENQDPLSPQENGEFIAQLAQFSSVEGMERLNTNFDNFTSSFISNQALQASSLVGRSVAVAGKEAQLSTDGMVGGIIELPASTTAMTMNIYRANGELAETIGLGAHSAGDVVFRWDGKRVEVDGELIGWEAEEALPAGRYTFEVLATQNGEPEQLHTALTANVNSVASDSQGRLTLNLQGIGAVSLDEVKQFN